MSETNGRPEEYRIVIRGRLSERLGAAFGELNLERRRGQTVLKGSGEELPLAAVLDRVRDLGLEVVSVDDGD
jgi:hypothetical protein